MNFAEFTAPTSGREGPRQAALLVHAMTASDREWLWAKLSAQEQENLQALLTELELLGIPSDPSMLTDALSSAPGNIAPPMAGGGMLEALHPSSPIELRLPSVSDEAFLAQLNSMDATVLATILRPEPALLIARVLRLRDWPWQDALLEKLNPGHRQKVRNLLQQPSEAIAGTALSDALLRHLRLRYEKAEHAASPGALNGSIYRSATVRNHKKTLWQWWRQVRGIFA